MRDCQSAVSMYSVSVSQIISARDASASENGLHLPPAHAHMVGACVLHPPPESDKRTILNKSSIESAINLAFLFPLFSIKGSDPGKKSNEMK